jgi:hypothetical protein
LAIAVQNTTSAVMTHNTVAPGVTTRLARVVELRRLCPLRHLSRSRLPPRSQSRSRVLFLRRQSRLRHRLPLQRPPQVLLRHRRRQHRLCQLMFRQMGGVERREAGQRVRGRRLGGVVVIMGGVGARMSIVGWVMGVGRILGRVGDGMCAKATQRGISSRSHKC